MARAAKSGKARAAASPFVAPVSNRSHAVDAARGVAVALMVGYHLCFDLTISNWLRSISTTARSGSPRTSPSFSCFCFSSASACI